MGGSCSKGCLVGIVHTSGRVLFVAGSTSRDGVMEQLAEWALGEARVKLGSWARMDMESLYAGGFHQEALNRYLAQVASTWDPEWVAIEELSVFGVRAT